MATAQHTYQPFFDRPANTTHARIENVYEYLYQGIPSTLAIYDNLDKYKVLDFLKAKFDRYFSSLICQEDGSTDQSFWISKDAKLIVEVSNLKLGFAARILDDSDVITSGACTLHAAADSVALLEELLQELQASCKTVSKSKIYMLVNYYGEVDLKPLEIPEVSVDLSLNYGENFPDVNKDIVESLNTKNSGLYLFYGEPGTGKSSYIKYLLSGVIKRKVVYVPINLINSLMSPDFLPLLLNNKNSILVIEDAEKALMSREDSPENSSLVSAILNLTDSFISTTLNISIVATFNTAKENLDKALLRKGRLKHSYEFKKLSKTEAQSLINHLGFEYKATSAMTLADIYNLNDKAGHKASPEKVIKGFGG